MADGSTAVTNGMAETQVTRCHFDANDDSGIWARDGGANQLADFEITDCHISASGEYGILAERTVGAKIKYNQIYTAGLGCIYVKFLARTVIAGNHLDLKAANLAAAGRAACVQVESFSSHGNWVIANNLFFINAAADTATKNLHGLAIMGASSVAGDWHGNAYVDVSGAGLGTELYLAAGAQTSLSKVAMTMLALEKRAAVLVAALPAAVTALKGARAWVTDATLTYVAANIGSAVTGGGANLVPVHCDGSAWKIG
jgi:hypothetical protein